MNASDKLVCAWVSKARAMICIVVEGTIPEMFQEKPSNLRVFPLAFGPDVMLAPMQHRDKNRTVHSYLGGHGAMLCQTWLGNGEKLLRFVKKELI